MSWYSSLVRFFVGLSLALLLYGCETRAPTETPAQEEWLAGDHHVHSRFSVLWNQDVDPPEPQIGVHGIYPIAMNALMAHHYGLAWMVTTDHGGRRHAKINLDLAYPNVIESREVVPDLIQFFGFEMNTPGSDHASIIVPHTHDEAERVYQIESRFDKFGAAPDDEGANTTGRMVEALGEMRDMPERPVVIANHPSRLATDGARFGRTKPEALRAWNDAAPDIAVGMAGAPGHQATALDTHGNLRSDRARGNYDSQPTYGGFDRMTAEVGGFWDSMLGEGRRWWITANSDSHIHWSDGGRDFWPGEYSKTYVLSLRDHDAVLENLRAGRVFVTTGDLISSLDVELSADADGSAEIGGTLVTRTGSEITVTIRFHDPAEPNARGESPSVRRVDLIQGVIEERPELSVENRNPSTGVIARFDEGDWTRDGEFVTIRHRLPRSEQDFYVRVRGTNTDEEEPLPDVVGEDPWQDLWFYSNPIFVERR